MTEKFLAFRTWWHSIFANWNPSKLPSYISWYFSEEQLPSVPGYVADAMLVVFSCMILSLLLPLLRRNKAEIGMMFTMKPIGIAVAALGTFTMFLGSSLFQTFWTSTLSEVGQLFTVDIPESWSFMCEQFAAASASADGFFGYMIDGPDLLGSIFELLINVILGPILALFSTLLHAGGAILCLIPFIGLFVVECIFFKWTAPVHFIADLGGGLLALLAIMALIFCGAIIMGIVMMGVYVIGFMMLKPVFMIITIKFDYDPYS